MSEHTRSHLSSSSFSPTVTRRATLRLVMMRPAEYQLERLAKFSMGPKKTDPAMA